MDLILAEPHPRKVLEAFRQGEFDGLEILGQADEKAFFELGFREKLLEALAESMPTARKKEEVPKWFVLAANLSLKLHGEHAFAAWDRVVRCGGLLSALDPALASKHLDPQLRQVVVQWGGFNDKNQYDRQTPCDQDMLRKFVRDVPAAQWQDWFNGSVQEVFQRYGFFDPEGVFIGDGSYLFVPDNPTYEGSVVLWFNEHNHPVHYEELSAAERKKAHRERCYKLVSLLHLRGQAYVYAAVAVVPGNRHELPIFYQLVHDFVQRVGGGDEEVDPGPGLHRRRPDRLLQDGAGGGCTHPPQEEHGRVARCVGLGPTLGLATLGPASARRGYPAVAACSHRTT